MQPLLGDPLRRAILRLNEQGTEKTIGERQGIDEAFFKMELDQRKILYNQSGRNYFTALVRGIVAHSATTNNKP
ncbi:MAG: hypothetical protein ACM37W_22420 [Actinomycetota bacterium]